MDDTDLQLDLLVDDEGGESGDDEPVHVQYDIATYPSDPTLSVLYDMWNDEEIVIPGFQRGYVWNIKQASALIESFLMGLPVPQVFFYIDDTKKSLVIDGQQRIMTVVSYFSGYFGDESESGKRQVFRLSGISKKSPYYNKRFEDLEAKDQRALKSSVLRVVNIRQLSPVRDESSMYHIFERLNTGGTPLRPQEIRNCVFHGEMVTTLKKANAYPSWRKILAQPKPDRHLRDVEVVLRVWALTEKSKHYEKPMKSFLNGYMKSYAKSDGVDIMRVQQAFQAASDLVAKHLPEKPFHVRGPLNLAALDSVMSVLVANGGKAPHDLAERYEKLLGDEKYKAAIFYNTSDISSIRDRMAAARKHLLDQ
ncbi:hypothetical protein PMI01_04671 [Caulobacter sp. AP07]|uniref:DUF262 domain-containing protein n=1 Tax=Caulobacter sp. AP07 TaxID=1144304 RepID=UPI000271DA63|nr:DUF262 domain-containing protein [Caulobacter sp. AP07]EJL24288.1 hypothetical protein PMI01_04671 [Caulobacter sp. AP07]